MGQRRDSGCDLSVSVTLLPGDERCSEHGVSSRQTSFCTHSAVNADECACYMKTNTRPTQFQLYTSLRHIAFTNTIFVYFRVLFIVLYVWPALCHAIIKRILMMMMMKKRDVIPVPQTWTWVGSIHGLDWVGLGRKFSPFGGLGWVYLCTW